MRSKVRDLMGTTSLPFLSLGVMVTVIVLVALPMIVSPIPHHDSVRHLLPVESTQLSPTACRQDPQSALLIRLGRPATAIIECIQFHLIDSLEGFRVLRIFAVVGLIGVATLIAVLIGARSRWGAAAGLSIVVLPGVMYNVQVGNLATISAWAAALVLAILVARGRLPSSGWILNLSACVGVVYIAGTYPAAFVLLLAGMAPLISRFATGQADFPLGAVWLTGIWIFQGVATSALLLRSGRADDPASEIAWAAGGTTFLILLAALACRKAHACVDNRNVYARIGAAIGLAVAAALLILRTPTGQVYDSFADTYSPASGVADLMNNLPETLTWAKFFFSFWASYLTLDLWVLGAVASALTLSYLLATTWRSTHSWPLGGAITAAILTPVLISWAQAMATSEPLVLNRTVGPGQASVLILLVFLLQQFLSRELLQPKPVVYAATGIVAAAILLSAVGVTRQTLMTSREYWQIRASVESWKASHPGSELRGIIVFREQWSEPLAEQIGDEYGAPSLFSNRYPLGVLPSFRVALSDVFPSRTPVYCQDAASCALEQGQIGVATTDVSRPSMGWALVPL
jgi:hypothetical protein